jgi:hypothetical protein
VRSPPLPTPSLFLFLPFPSLHASPLSPPRTRVLAVRPPCPVARPPTLSAPAAWPPPAPWRGALGPRRRGSLRPVARQPRPPAPGRVAPRRPCARPFLAPRRGRPGPLRAAPGPRQRCPRDSPGAFPRAQPQRAR